MIRSSRSLISLLPAFATLALFTACVPPKTVKKSGASTAAEASSAATPDVDVSEAGLRGKEFSNVPDLLAVHFDYDKYALGSEAQATLKDNASYLKSHPDLEVLVEGHCDQRGTIEYNLALGQKRAKEVRDYYIRLGVPAKTVATISFGKERPLCSEMNDECWAKNRRAETKVRSLAASNDTNKTPTP